jgi:hypothetical protein
MPLDSGTPCELAVFCPCLASLCLSHTYYCLPTKNGPLRITDVHCLGIQYLLCRFRVQSLALQEQGLTADTLVGFSLLCSSLICLADGLRELDFP